MILIAPGLSILHSDNIPSFTDQVPVEIHPTVIQLKEIVKILDGYM